MAKIPMELIQVEILAASNYVQTGKKSSMYNTFSILSSVCLPFPYKVLLLKLISGTGPLMPLREQSSWHFSCKGFYQRPSTAHHFPSLNPWRKQQPSMQVQQCIPSGFKHLSSFMWNLFQQPGSLSLTWDLFTMVFLGGCIFS